MIASYKIDNALLSCVQTKNGRVSVSIDFLVELGLDGLVSPAILANYRRAPDRSRTGSVDAFPLRSKLEELRAEYMKAAEASAKPPTSEAKSITKATKKKEAAA